MPVVSHTLTRPGGAPMADEIIHIRLLASAAGEGEGFVATTQSGILSEYKLRTDSTGTWSLSLTANALITPANTTYQVIQPGVNGTKVTETFIVPNAAGPFWLGDILAEAPAGLPGYALDVHNLDPDAHTGSLALIESLGSSFEPLTVESLADVTTNPRPIGTVDGVLYGRGSNGVGLHRSTTSGATWEFLQNLPAGDTPLSIVKAGTEVLIARNTSGIWRSSGWSTNPATATFTQVVVPNGASWMLPWALATHDNIAICSEYISGANMTDARYVKVSTDYGVTWTTRFDLNTYALNPEASHVHGVAIDPFVAGTPRLWFSWHHANAAAPERQEVLYSDDLGVTWAVVTTVYQPTAMVATPAGMVFGSDDSDDGIYRVLRTTNPADMVYERVEDWRPGPYTGLHGFAMHAIYDSVAQFAYIGFTVSQSAITSAIFATDGRSATEVWRHPTPHAAGLPNGVRVMGITSERKLVAHVIDALTTNFALRTRLTHRAGRSTARLDPGRVLGGASASKNDIAVGLGSSASGEKATATGALAVAGAQCVAIGFQANAPASDSVAIGHAAQSRNQSVVIGHNATLPATSASSVIIGHGAAATIAVIDVVVIGRGASATNGNATVVGRSATGGASGTAIGQGTTASTDATAIGRGATANHSFSVALGRNATTNSADQIQIAARHIELSELAADAVAPATDRARLYIKDNGAGKTQMCVRFATGAVQILATEP